MYSGSFFDWVEMAKRDEEPSKPNSGAAVLAEVIVTAADMIDTDGVIRLLCELTDSRKAVEQLVKQNVRSALDQFDRDEEIERSMNADALEYARILNAKNDEFNRLVTAIDAERADYARILANREQEITDVRNLLDEMTDRHWKFVNNCGPNTGPAVAAMVSGAVLDAARLFAATNNKISAIKDFRKSTGLGLREAKMICDQIAEAVRMEMEVYND